MDRWWKERGFALKLRSDHKEKRFVGVYSANTYENIDRNKQVNTYASLHDFLFSLLSGLDNQFPL